MMLMNSVSSIVDEHLLESMTEVIVEAIQPQEVILFGSHAKGVATPGSDFDFLVVVPDSNESRTHRRRLTGDLYRKLAPFPVAKDILLYTRSEFDHWRSVPGHVVFNGLREGRRLYAKP